MSACASRVYGNIVQFLTGLIRNNRFLNRSKLTARNFLLVSPKKKTKISAYSAGFALYNDVIISIFNFCAKWSIFPIMVTIIIIIIIFITNLGV